jgi:hypothetical protein
MGMGGQRYDPAGLLRGKRSGTLRKDAGCVQGQVWKGAEILASTGIRSPDRPARSKSLYRLRYPGPLFLLSERDFKILELKSMQIPAVFSDT